jgi:hypothetical protein
MVNVPGSREHGLMAVAPGGGPERRFGLHDRRWCQSGGRRGHAASHAVATTWEVRDVAVRIPAMPIARSGRCRSPVPAKAITRGVTPLAVGCPARRSVACSGSNPTRSGPSREPTRPRACFPANGEQDGAMASAYRRTLFIQITRDSAGKSVRRFVSTREAARLKASGELIESALASAGTCGTATRPARGNDERTTARTKSDAQRIALDLERKSERQRQGLEPMPDDAKMTSVSCATGGSARSARPRASSARTAGCRST